MTKIKAFVGETIVYGFGNIFSRVFAMLMIPLYATYLGKIDYSNLIMIQTIFSLLTFFLALNAGVFFYYYEYENIRYRKIVFTSWFYYQFIFALVLVVLLIFISPHLTGLFLTTPENINQIRWGIVLAGVLLFPYIFNITNINFFRIERKPTKAITIVALEAGITLVLVYLTLAVFKKGIVWVLSSQIVSRVIVSLLFIKYSSLYIRFRNFSRKLLRKIIAYTWPFIAASMASWVIVSMDKFIGVQALTDKTDVALLALAMQLILPVTVLDDMIRMAIGPYVMSIRKDDDAKESYQKVFELSVFSSVMVVIGVILFTPLLTILLTDTTYLPVIKVIPLMGIANVFLLASNQFCISFSLVKKTIFILWGLLIASSINVAGNLFLMNDYGFIISGVTQILGYLCMAVFLFLTGKKFADLQIKIRNSLILFGLLLLYVFIIMMNIHQIINGDYILFIIAGITLLIAVFLIYFRQQRVHPFKLLQNFFHRT